MIKINTAVVLVFYLLLASVRSFADAVYMSHDDFLKVAFDTKMPVRETLWLDKDIKAQAKAILLHDFAPLRVRYWRVGDRTAWSFDEVGKERPITMGVVVSAGAIEKIEVLVYRESRGAEIRHPFFTEQYFGAKLQDQRLDKDIDGITGATMSVRAATRVATLALLLHNNALYQLQ